jgi:epoxyqueuosine reductase
MDRSALTREIKQAALALGFDGVGVTLVRPLPSERFLSWLQRGFHGGMQYLERDPARRLDPELVLPGARSILSLIVHYEAGPAREERPDVGVIARYARGRDYHRVLEPRLRALLGRIRELAPGTSGRWYTDTGPILEKAWAQAAGLGWVGKHTNLIAGKSGSYFFLAELLLDLELEPDIPAPDHCGSCTRCLDACPTQAIVAPYVLDASRCISYLTIEHRGDLPEALRPHLGNLVFGCDICQEVCPWNRTPAPAREPAFSAQARDLRLTALAELNPESFARVFSGSAVKRAKWRGFLRNVAVALGNWGDRRAIPALRRLAASADELVARHAAWALGRIEEVQPAGVVAGEAPESEK